MKTIWKFTLKLGVGGLNDFWMPRGATILSLQVQRGEPRMWALVEDTNEVEKRSFRIVGTGHELPAASDDIELYAHFVDTFQVSDGDFVFHVFEVAS